MKILSIGNSYSKDAQRYLHSLAKQDGEDIKAVNLFIGGCPLIKHYLNLLFDRADYAFEFNGENTGIYVSIRQALESDEWDYITLQQQSSRSANYATFSPYIEALAEYVRKHCPHSKILLHETWAYEDGCERMKNLVGCEKAEDMYAAVHSSYQKAAKLINADGIIPNGTAMIRAVQMGIGKIHRDTYHASLGAGRYLLALLWYKTLTGNDISNNTFSDFDVPVTEEERKIVLDAVNGCDITVL